MKASETGFLSTISVMMQKLSQKPGFLDFGILGGGSETGFLPKSWWGFRDYRRNPVSWIY
ncbi:MAG: hypothetical protein EAZ90_14190 [Oscillatoriales cyanobacterium]|nr:MAG: hypothetical protein EAZ90_14190 [Oscillatoriales cyanobacterium]